MTLAPTLLAVVTLIAVIFNAGFMTPASPGAATVAATLPASAPKFDAPPAVVATEPPTTATVTAPAAAATAPLTAAPKIAASPAANRTSRYGGKRRGKSAGMRAGKSAGTRDVKPAAKMIDGRLKGLPPRPMAPGQPNTCAGSPTPLASEGCKPSWFHCPKCGTGFGMALLRLVSPNAFGYHTCDFERAQNPVRE